MPASDYPQKDKKPKEIQEILQRKRQDSERQSDSPTTHPLGATLAPSHPGKEALSPPNLYLLALLVSACSMAYELILAQKMASIATRDQVWYGFSIAAFLAGMGLGIISKSKRPISIISLELAVSLAGALSVAVIMLLHTIYRIHLIDHLPAFISSLDVTLLGCMSLCILMGLVSGLELKFIDLQTKPLGGRRWALIFGLYYLGGLIGTLTLSLWLLPHLGLFKSAICVASINWVLAIWLLAGACRNHTLVGKHWLPGLAVGLTISALAVFSDAGEQIYLKNFYHNTLRVETTISGIKRTGPQALTQFVWKASLLPRIERRLTPYQAIDLVKRETAGDFDVFMNMQYQFGTKTLAKYHQAMAHIAPILLGPDLKEILVLGGGDGMLATELLRYNPHRITIVEIDAAVFAMAKAHPAVQLNQGSLSDPRVHLVVADALTWLRGTTDERFDAAFLDIPSPYSTDTTRLVSYEALALVRSRLNPGGFVVADHPIRFDQVDSPINQTLAYTLALAGFTHSIAYKPFYESFVVASLQTITWRPQHRLSFAPLALRGQALEQIPHFELSFEEKRRQPSLFGYLPTIVNPAL